MTRGKRNTPLGRASWLKAAKAAIIHEGIGGVEIGKLARKLRATRGGFYWFFKNRDELLDCLLADWEVNNTAVFKAVLRDDGVNGLAELSELCDIWINESGYSPQWDAAMREWARISPRADAVVRRVDDQRIEIIHRIFKDMGYDDPEANVRACTTYFHQVGYYTLGVRESREQRLRRLPFYIAILSGRK